jgi:hypothetical protein
MRGKRVKEDEIRRRVMSALEEFLRADAELLVLNVGEQAITGRLAFHLGHLFPDHQVDVEYDRHGLDRKKLDLPPECKGGGIHMVIPDIVVHRRGDDGANVLAIELKKETNPESRDCDRAKLSGMRFQLGYEAAALVEVPAGPGATGRATRIEWH